MTEIDEIIGSIEDRLRQLNEEIRTLTVARAALDTRAARATGRHQREMTRRVSRANDGTSGRAATKSAGHAVVAGPGPSREVAPPAPRKRVRVEPRRSPERGSVGAVAAERLELLLSERGAMTTSALAERARGKRDQILAALRELEAAGRIRRSGQRRSTRWHVITDDARIQKRAAELTARSKTAG